MDKLEYKLNVIQSIITRMANNSSNCKLWCITLLTGILVFYFQENSINNKLIVLLPLIPFMLLDAYYLGLEKYYIALHDKIFATDDEKKIIPHETFLKKILAMLKAFFSFSVCGFYLLIAVIIFFIIN